MNLIELTKFEQMQTRGGNPILVGLGVLTTAISLGKAADQAGTWFLQGWSHPQ